MPGRLNIFQRIILVWNDLHPYNAVHVVEMPGSADLDRLYTVLEQTLQTHGLTGLTINRKQATYQYKGGPSSVHIEDVEAGRDTQAVLSREIHQQLNTRFQPDGEFNPFRFFVIRKPASFLFGIAYCHVVAGAESIVLLMQDLTNSFLELEGRGLRAPLDLYPVTYGPWLRRHPLVLLRKLANLPGLFGNLKHSLRPRYRDEMDTANGFSLSSLEAEQLSLITVTSRSWGVTVNDMLLAILLKTLAPLKKHRASSRRRNRLSIGTIVNIRKDMDIDSHHTFGIFLGSFSIHHKVPPDICLKDLALDVKRQTGKIKRSRRYMGAPVDFAAAIRTMKALNSKRKRKFYQKHYPLWAGVTNMNLNPVWPQSGDEGMVNYIRAVSTGSATPLVLSFTTTGDIANISISYRTTVYSTADIDQVKRGFLRLLENPEGDL